MVNSYLSNAQQLVSDAPECGHVLFVGNASYQNRGCEAIVRGTVDILAETMQGLVSFTNAFYGDRKAFRSQTSEEQDPRISHLRLDAYPRKWTRPWAEARLNERLGLGFSSVHAPLAKPADSAFCALEIGGDNYTTDYGFPAHLIAMDRWLMQRGKPVVIWGASIGPFSENPEQERVMMDHLRSLRGVFVRESATYDYLANQHGLTNIYHFADPAFVMTPQEPEDKAVRVLVAEMPLAINISPLLASFRGRKRAMPWEITTLALESWIMEAAELVSCVRKETDLPVLLVPHVGSTSPGIDDFGFLKAVHQKCLERGVDRISLADQELNARELKWIISQCRALVAARTHATIAAFSTGVPTISLGYSRKALGINQDVFGSTEYCLKANELAAGALVKKVSIMLEKESVIREHLTARGAQLRASAIAAGPKLLQLINS
jgi:colanic acid/amylovoran biosynthesis protein